MGDSDIYGVSDANQSTINSRRTGKLRIDQGSINCGVQLKGKFSKIRGIFDSRILVTTTE